MATHIQSGSSSPSNSLGTAQTRRVRPNNVFTNLAVSQTVAGPVPPSAVSNSSMATTSSSMHDSPLMTPEQATSSSSMQPSPDGPRGRELDQVPPPFFQLPGPVISRKTSTNSLGITPGHAVQGPGLMRRLSNRVMNKNNRRRQSSVNPNSRDASIGPGILRRRSDSANTAPSDQIVPALFTDSDDDGQDEWSTPAFGYDGTWTEMTSPVPGTSMTGSASAPPAGPVIPGSLLKGNVVTNVKKGKRRRLRLVLDASAAKVTWDRNKQSKSFYIDDIKAIYMGDDTKQYRLDCNVPEDEESRFFSVSYAVPEKNKYKVLHVIADDVVSFIQWTQTLDAISKHRQDQVTSLTAFNDKAIRGYWESEMSKQAVEKGHSEGDGLVDFPTVERICRNLYINAAQRTLQAHFQAAKLASIKENGSHGTGAPVDSTRLNYVEFQEFVRLMKRRADVTAIYREIASDVDSGITFKDFTTFLCDVQGEAMDKDWLAIFKRFCRRGRPKEQASKAEDGSDAIPRMSEAALASFLTSKYSSPHWEPPEEYELNHPLNEYFISSSHNTYLTGRQIKGKSSIEGYVDALMYGCRCVEVDCWDGHDGQPIVVHGRTFTTSISFREVINTINRNAFRKTSYPLFISLEVHCTAPQQQIMVDIMKEVFGERLVTERLPSAMSTLPTPSELKGRILVKAKRPQNWEEPRQNGEVTGRKRGNSQPSPYLRPESVGTGGTNTAQTVPSSPLVNASAPSPRLHKAPTFPRVDTIAENEIHDSISSSSSDCDEGLEAGSSRKTSKIIKALGSLAVYSMGLKFTGFDTPDAKTFNHIYSFKEGTFAKNSQPNEKKRQLFRHNMRYLMRVYPNQTRIASTNFDPLIYWKRGVQMVALNWQTFDLGMQLNRAMFQGGTDATGYVLKPTDLREFQVRTSPAPEAAGARHRTIVNFSIDVISAQQLTRPIGLSDRRTVDPYVEVEIFTPDDKRSKPLPVRDVAYIKPSPEKKRTEIVRENGFNPLFDAKFNFSLPTKCPEMVFIRFSVKFADAGGYNDRPPHATYMAKLSSLKQGFRTIPLWNGNGDEYLFSTLFCRIKVEPSESVMMHYAGNGADNPSKLKTLGGRVFNRSSNQTPKSSMDSGLTVASGTGV